MTANEIFEKYKEHIQKREKLLSFRGLMFNLFITHYEYEIKHLIVYMMLNRYGVD